MARAIDKQTMLDLIIEAKRMDPETGSFSEWLAEYLVDHLPTLTPPNEALTLEQLREMDGQPVWVDDEKIWALLQVWDDDNIDIVFPMPRGCFHAKSVLGKKIYRRPPEGEEK